MNLPSIDTIVTEAIAARIWPGAVVRVARGGELLHAAAYGTTMYGDLGSQKVTLATRYDIASLTKVFTATAALQLIDEGQVDADGPLVRYLPRSRAKGVAVRHLLTHTSGLSLRLSLLRAAGRAALLDAVYALAPSAAPGTTVAYTNINSLLLGEVVAAVRRLPLDAVIQRWVLDPLGLDQTGFLPDRSLHGAIAPTEWDDDWRGGLVQGTVHDESAHALGGVAGHAGLFSTARDILRFCQVWRSGGAPLLSRELAALAVQNQTPDLPLACGLGWMLDRPNFMGAAPPGSYGHTGFTGPAMVVLPTSGHCIVVLTNRTYPRRGPPTHHAVIGRIVGAVMSDHTA